MRCNVKLDLSDAQRNALAQLLTGKPTKRYATREEVAQYVLGAVEGITQPAPEAAPEPANLAPRAQVEGPKNPLTEAERATVQAKLAEGRSIGWIRGWIYAGRRINSTP